MRGFRSFLVISVFMSCVWWAQTTTAQDGTYGVTASVMFCDANPRDPAVANPEDVCGAAIDGTQITLTDPAGTIGSCVTESVDTPWGGVSNYCSIDGAGFETTLTFTVDTSTLPEGYTLVENELSIDVDTLIPGGGDGTTVTFVATASDTGTSTDSVMPKNGAIGFFADIVTGSCDTPGESAAILEAVVTETGAPVGATSGLGPETSFSTVAIPLDTLIDQPHMISIYGVNDRAGDRILCGDIGGVDNDDGTLYIVLRATDASIDATGLVQLSYGDDLASDTNVRLFLIPTS